MDPENLIQQMQDLAARNGIHVRYEKGDFEGGFCVLKKERIVVINKKLPLSRRLSVMAQGLASFGIDQLEMDPALRAVIEDELVKAARIH